MYLVFQAHAHHPFDRRHQLASTGHHQSRGGLSPCRPRSSDLGVRSPASRPGQATNGSGSSSRLPWKGCDLSASPSMFAAWVWRRPFRCSRRDVSCSTTLTGPLGGSTRPLRLSTPETIAEGILYCRARAAMPRPPARRCTGPRSPQLAAALGAPAHHGAGGSGPPCGQPGWVDRALSASSSPPMCCVLH